MTCPGQYADPINHDIALARRDFRARMSAPLPPIRQTRARRHIVLVVAAAILFAGIAQAAHFHKAELAGGNGDVHCLLCLYAASSAAPPAPAQLIPATALPLQEARCPADQPCPRSHAPASYDARGPPSA